MDSNEPIAESEEINVPEIHMKKVAKVQSILLFKEDQEIDIFFDDGTNIENFSLYLQCKFPGEKVFQSIGSLLSSKYICGRIREKATENEMA